MQQPTFPYPHTFDLPEEEKQYIRRNAPNEGSADWSTKWKNILIHGKRQNPQWSIYTKHQALARKRGKSGFDKNELNEIKEEVELNPRVYNAPTRGMKYNDNSCWFDALAFVILADPTEQIVRCLEDADDVFRNYLRVVRNFMYGEGNDPDTSSFIRGKYTNNVQRNPDTLPNELHVCGIEWNEFSNEHPPETHTKILFVRRDKHVPDEFTLYGHVFYSGRDKNGHYTSGIYVNDGKFLYYDDNDSTIENRLRLLKRVPNSPPTGGNRFTVMWNVYYRFVDGGETKRQVPAVPACETKVRDVAKRLMQYPESKDHSEYGGVFSEHKDDIGATFKEIYKIAINAVNIRLQDDISVKITPDTLFSLFLKSYDHIERALKDGENPETLVFHCENNLSKFLWDVQTTIKNIEKRREGREPGIYLDTYNNRGRFASRQIYDLDETNGNIVSRERDDILLNVNACIFYDMEGHVVERDKLKKDQVYQVFHIPEDRFDRVRFIYQDKFEKTREMIRSIFLNIGQGEDKLILADKIIFIENDKLTNFFDLTNQYNENEAKLIRKSYKELISHMSNFDATLVIKSIFKERAKEYENYLDAMSDDENDFYTNNTNNGASKDEEY